MDRETLEEADRLLLRCGARAISLLHPNREHPPTPAEAMESRANLASDLRALALAIPVWLRKGDDDLHASENGRGR